MGERLHPGDSMRTVGGDKPAVYGANMATALMSAAVRTFQGSPAEKRELVNQVVQRGIDFYFNWKNGKSYHSDGGINAGRKPAILYAGYMLSPQLPAVTSAMLNLPTDKFQEDMFTYRGTREALWGDFSGDACSSDASPAQNDTTRRCDGTRDGGICKTGTACSGTTLQPTPDQQRSSRKVRPAARTRCTPTCTSEARRWPGCSGSTTIGTGRPSSSTRIACRPLRGTEPARATAASTSSRCTALMARMRRPSAVEAMAEAAEAAARRRGAGGAGPAATEPGAALLALGSLAARFLGTGPAMERNR